MVLTVTEDTPADMLTGSMELLVQLPMDHHVPTQRVTVERSTAMMDLLVQIATSHKLAASSYTLQAIGERGLVLPHQPNTPIGALDALQVKLLPKQGTFIPRKSKQPNQPFETTFRLQVHLPRNQLYVSRVSPKMNLGEILGEVCREKNLDRNKYELRHPGNHEEILDLSLSLQDYHLQEVTLYAKQGQSLGSALSSQDIMALQRQEERRRHQAKQSVFGFMFRKSKESSLSTDSLGGRSVSPSHSDETGRSVSPLAPPTRPQRKRRPAPNPPVSSKNNNNELSKDENKEKLVISHSRNSSDSSGYHEASVLSDNPDSAGRMPETLPRRSKTPGKGAFETRKLAQTSQTSKSLSNLAVSSASLSHATSNTSLSSTGIRKKRAAPQPPIGRPLSSAISTLALERIIDSEESLTSDMGISKPPSDIEANSKANSDIAVGRHSLKASNDFSSYKSDKSDQIERNLPERDAKMTTDVSENKSQIYEQVDAPEKNVEPARVKRDEEESPSTTDILLQKVSSTLSTVLPSPSPLPQIPPKSPKTAPKPEETDSTPNQTLNSQQDTSDYVSATGDDLSAADWEYQLPDPPSAFRDTSPDTFGYETITLGSTEAFKDQIAIIDRSEVSKIDKNSQKSPKSSKTSLNSKPEVQQLNSMPDVIKTQKTESPRVSYESTRVSSEVSRVSSEVSRVTSESTRVSSEVSRVSSESTRILSESPRVSSEVSRILSESPRVSSESPRTSTESPRVSPESPRIPPESPRVSTESLRSSDLKKTIISELETKIENGDFSSTNKSSPEDAKRLSNKSTPKLAPVDNTLANFTITTYPRDRNLNIYDNSTEKTGIYSNSSEERVVKTFATLSRSRSSIPHKEALPRLKSAQNNAEIRSKVITKAASVQNINSEDEEFKKPNLKVIERLKAPLRSQNHLNDQKSSVVHRSKSYIVLSNNSKYREEKRPLPDVVDDSRIYKSTSYTNLNQENSKNDELQSVQVLKSILPHLKNAQFSNEAEKGANGKFEDKSMEEPKKSIVETKKTYKYTGPPAISLGSWSERPCVNVQIKHDTDYKFGFKSNQIGGKTCVNLNSTSNDVDIINYNESKLMSKTLPKTSKNGGFDDNSDKNWGNGIFNKKNEFRRNSEVEKIEISEKKTSFKGKFESNYVKFHTLNGIEDKPGINEASMKKLDDDVKIDTRPVNFKELTQTFGQVNLRNKGNIGKNSQNRHSDFFDSRNDDKKEVIKAVNEGNRQVIKRYTSVIGIHSQNNGFNSEIKVNKINGPMPVVKGFKSSSHIKECQNMEINSNNSINKFNVPTPPTMPVITGVTLKNSNLRQKSVGLCEEPRDQLLESIRNFGRDKLRSVSTVS